jgi:hypothetical protein
MAIREIPKTFEYTCDRCGAIHNHQGAGHYTNSTPDRWSKLKFQPREREGWSRELLLCDSCTEQANSMLSSFATKPSDPGTVPQSGPLLISDDDDRKPVTYEDNGKSVTKMMSRGEIQHARFMGGIGDEVWD